MNAPTTRRYTLQITSYDPPNDHQIRDAIAKLGAGGTAVEIERTDPGAFDPAVAVATGTTTVGPLVIDHDRREVRVAGELVELANKELELLAKLASDPARVHTKQELLREIWGIADVGIRTRTLDSHASRLRRKLSIAGGHRFVICCWGVGYRLTDQIATQAREEVIAA